MYGIPPARIAAVTTNATTAGARRNVNASRITNSGQMPYVEPQVICDMNAPCTAATTSSGMI